MGQYWFTFHDGNGEIVLRSGHYDGWAKAMIGIAHMKVKVHDNERYERKKDSDGRFYFNFRTEGNEVNCTSQTYDDSPGREALICIIKLQGLQGIVR